MGDPASPATAAATTVTKTDHHPDGTNNPESVAHLNHDQAGGGDGIVAKKNVVRRLCRIPGCIKVVKSQGMCQRHGAKAKRCRVEGCDKQAQGTHDGMCKRHWKDVHFPDQDQTTEKSAKKNNTTRTSHKNSSSSSNDNKVKSGSESQPPEPSGASVYDSILPLSISYRLPTVSTAQPAKQPRDAGIASPTPEAAATAPAKRDESTVPAAVTSVAEVTVMPLVTFLKEGQDQEPGWHRNAERLARGVHPVNSLSTQLEPWERQLALAEILLLSGGTPHVSFKDLAHAWGRDKGFHHVLANSVCERRGEVERKRRKDKVYLSEVRDAPKGKRLCKDTNKKEKEAELVNTFKQPKNVTAGDGKNHEQQKPAAKTRASAAARAAVAAASGSIANV